MSKSNVCENGWLDLVFKNIDFTGIGDAGGLRGSVSAGSLYISLHASDPGEAGDQTTNEAAYPGYQRVAVARGSGFTRTGNVVSPAASIEFPEATASGGTTYPYFGIGTAASGAGKLLYSGTATPPADASAAGRIPRLTTGTTVTED